MTVFTKHLIESWKICALHKKGLTNNGIRPVCTGSEESVLGIWFATGDCDNERICC